MRTSLPAKADAIRGGLVLVAGLVAGALWLVACLAAGLCALLLVQWLLFRAWDAA